MRTRGISGWRGAGRIAACLTFGTAMAGCVDAGHQARPVVVPEPAVSHDGRYEGTIRVTGASMGMDLRDCETPSRTTVMVTDNRFSLAVPHPRVAEAAPSLQDRTTPVYSATIGSDGNFAGVSGTSSATMHGRVSGRRMTGEVHGLLCSYEFTADRI